LKLYILFSGNVDNDVVLVLTVVEDGGVLKLHTARIGLNIEPCGMPLRTSDQRDISEWVPIASITSFGMIIANV